VLLTLTARTPEDLGLLGGWLHDAYFEHEEITFDQGSQVVAIPFAQEAGNAMRSPLASEHLRRTWRYEDWRIPFFRGSLTGRDAAGFDQDESGTGEPEMLGGISYSDGALHAGPRPSRTAVRATMRALSAGAYGSSAQAGGGESSPAPPGLVP
jgi:hypothetical protein